MGQKKSIILVIVLSVILFFVGLYSYGAVIVWLLPKGHVKYQSYDVSSLPWLLVYCLVFALFPFTVWMLWKTRKINSISKRLFSIGLILGTIAVFTFIRRFWIAVEIKRFSNEEPVMIALNQVKFEIYMLFGFITGSVLSFLLFRRKIF